MRATKLLVVSLANDPVLMYEHSTHHWIGSHMAIPQLRQFNTTVHVASMFIDCRQAPKIKKGLSLPL